MILFVQYFQLLFQWSIALIKNTTAAYDVIVLVKS